MCSRLLAHASVEFLLRSDYLDDSSEDGCNDDDGYGYADVVDDDMQMTVVVVAVVMLEQKLAYG